MATNSKTNLWRIVHISSFWKPVHNGINDFRKTFCDHISDFGKNQWELVTVSTGVLKNRF